MNSEKHQELRTRPKAFALRIIRMSQALHGAAKRMSSLTKCSDRPPEWPPTIARLVGQDPSPSSSPKLVLLLKKQTKLSTGSRCYWTAEWFALKNCRACLRKLHSWWPYSRRHARPPKVRASLMIPDSARFRRFRRSPLLQRSLHERSHVLLQFAQRRVLDIHHVPGAVVAQADFCVLGRVERHVVERVLRGEIRSGQVEVA